MGKFMRLKNLRYEGGEKHRICNINSNMWSYFKVVGIVNEFKYVGQFKLWWKSSTRTLDKDLKLFSLDKDAIELANYAEESKDEPNIYVEHIVNEMHNIELVHFIEGSMSGTVDGESLVINEQNQIGVGAEVNEQGEVGEEEGQIDVGLNGSDKELCENKRQLPIPTAGLNIS
ncbi:unnamed protein product [Sphenostylis stenocarpa]|uniref:PB1-like domain-containing protein n=1 Tax=Sphenostylis stenocarpa TaxID=92480 RepID=A0AA86VJZ3_9FABA|nr:unnamed protein product [Sphenostylis stenocarpa]